MRTPILLVASLVVATVAHDARAADDAPPPSPPTAAPGVHGDLFPGAGRPTVAGATGLPFLGIAEVGFGVTNGFTVGAVGGITPSVVTAGLRPRFRVPTSERTALVLVVPMLYYPKASAPGPGNIGETSWVLARPELFFDVSTSERWEVGVGMGFVAAGSTYALGQFFEGRKFAMPPYNGSTDSDHGFAGGVWNTACTRASYALDGQTHLFAEGSLVMKGIALANDVGGPPIVVTLGAQHSF